MIFSTWEILGSYGEDIFNINVEMLIDLYGQNQLQIFEMDTKLSIRYVGV